MAIKVINSFLDLSGTSLVIIEIVWEQLSEIIYLRQEGGGDCLCIVFFILISNNPLTQSAPPDEDSSPTVNIFLLCGNFPISPVLPVCRISSPENWRD